MTDDIDDTISVPRCDAEHLAQLLGVLDDWLRHADELALDSFRHFFDGTHKRHPDHRWVAHSLGDLAVALIDKLDPPPTTPGGRRQ